jgi:transcriptional regulator with XRE-family HTH domain
MRNLEKFGNKLSELRKRRNLNITQASKKIGVSHSYISKLEGGKVRPSILILKKITKSFQLSLQAQAELYSLAGQIGILGEKSIQTTSVKQVISDAKVISANDSVVSQKSKIVEIPKGMPAVYSDSAFITTNKFGAMIDFAQNVVATSTQIVVSRVGLSLKHAEELAKMILKQVEKAKEEENE